MKRILLLLPVLILFFSFKSYAYSQDDLTKIDNVFYQKYNRHLSNSAATQILNKWEEVKDTKPYGYFMTNNSTDFYSVFSSSAISLNSTSVNVSGQLISNWFYSDSTNRTLTWTQASGTYNGTISLSLGSWSDFHVIPINWDSPYYSPNIPAPTFDVYNRELNVVPTIDVPLQLDFQYVPTNTYVEIWADYTVPTDILVKPMPNNSAQYSVQNYNINSVNVLDKEDLFESSAISGNYVHVILTQGWNDVLTNYPISNINFINPLGNSAWLENRIEDYTDLRKTCTLYGSAIKIKVRYFSIVNDTQFVVGSWRIWDSTRPDDFTDEIPQSYQVYLPASGTTGTSTDTSTNVDIPFGSGTPTGYYTEPGVNVYYPQTVPNYPDYPTIASYNKDNLLVDTINGVKGLETFFGDFGGFLTASFAFIPSWIWAIIGVGFSLSIVVMFLKIL